MPPPWPPPRPNLDNSYVTARISRDLGHWSLCSYEAWTTRVEGPQSCVYDEQMATDADGWYTVVVSRAADHPRNAVAECGVNWVAWPETGDGAGHVNDGFVMLRNMLPAPDFTQTPQATSTGDDEKQVMGDHLPDGSHTTTAAFEQRGCGAGQTD